MTNNTEPDAQMPQTQRELMARIDQAWTQLGQMISALDEPQRMTVRDEQGWSVKDHLVHITTWEQSLLALLQGRDRDQAIGVQRTDTEELEIDDVNAVIYRRNRDRAWDDVFATFQGGHDKLLAVLTPLSDADLFKPYSHYQPNNPPFNHNPVIGWISGDTYEYYDEHAGWIRGLQQGQ